MQGADGFLTIAVGTLEVDVMDFPGAFVNLAFYEDRGWARILNFTYAVSTADASSAGDVGIWVVVVARGQVVGVKELLAGNLDPMVVSWILLEGSSTGSYALEVTFEPGQYDLIVTDYWGYNVAVRLPFTVGAASTSSVPGIQNSTAYKRGQEVTFDIIARVGLTPPLTVQLRDYDTDSIVFASVELAPGAYSGSGVLALPEDAPFGYYDLYVCGAGGVCGFAAYTWEMSSSFGGPAFISVSDFQVGLDNAPIAPGEPLTFRYYAPGLALPLVVYVQGLDSDGNDNQWGVMQPVNSTSELDTAVIELSFDSSALPMGPYYVWICDGIVPVYDSHFNFCYQVSAPPSHFYGDSYTLPVIVVGEFNLTGVEEDVPYAVGEHLSFEWSTEGETLPLTISVYSGSDEVQALRHDADNSTGSHHFDLTGLARGWYALWLCDAYSVCEAVPFTYIGAPLPPAEVVPLASGPAVQFDLAFGGVSCDFFSGTVEAATQLTVAHQLGVGFNDVDVSCRVVSGAPARRALAVGGTALTVTVSKAAALLSSVLQQAGGGAGDVALLFAVLERFTGSNLAQFVDALEAAAPANTFTLAQLQALELVEDTLALVTYTAAPSSAAPPAKLNIVGIAVGVVVGALGLVAIAMAWLYCVPKVAAAGPKLALREASAV